VCIVLIVRLAQVLDALGESVPCASYDSWMVYVPEGQFLSRIGPTEFLKVSYLIRLPALGSTCIFSRLFQ
jgi:hypothetical protein